MTKFIFNLDGTVTSHETSQLIAKHFNVQEEIEYLTKETIQGNVPFIESFIKKIHILRKFPVSEVETLIEKVEIYPELLDFIQKHKENCIVLTENFECWFGKLLKKFGCDYYCSESYNENDEVVKLTKVLRKEIIVEKYKIEGYRVVFIGCENNDYEAMRIADIAIAAGMTNYPSKSILPITNYLIFNNKALCRQLNQLL